MPPKKKTATKKQVETLIHEDANCRNIPTAEFEAVVSKEDRAPIEVAHEGRTPRTRSVRHLATLPPTQ